jgi:hypothetical protein
MLSWEQGNNYGTNFITRRQINEKHSLLHTDKKFALEFTEMIYRAQMEVITARGSIKAQLEMDYNAPERRSAFHVNQQN